MRPKQTYLGRQILQALADDRRSQKDLAATLGWNGNRISNIVCGQRQDPQFSTVVKIARALERPLEYFVEPLDAAVEREGL